MEKRYVSMVVNWIKDPDAKHKDCKILCYIND